jgi:hypothetical protein
VLIRMRPTADENEVPAQVIPRQMGQRTYSPATWRTGSAWA